MPTNLKNLLSRSRSRNELKGRGEKGDENYCSCRSNENGTCSSVVGTEQTLPACQPVPQCQCNCSSGGVVGKGEAEGSSGRMRRDVSCRSLFTLPGDESQSRPGSPTGGKVIGISYTSSSPTPSPKLPSASSTQSAVPIRKCETVLALSTFSTVNGGGPSSAGTSAPGRVRLMKDKILSTSSSALNSILHSSNKTTSKLLAGWKLSSNSSTSQSNTCVNSTTTTTTNNTPKSLPGTMAPDTNNSKSKSQASIFEDRAAVVAPLTPMNRLRRNGSVNNTRCMNSGYSGYSSVTSVQWKDDMEEILCRLCLCNVKKEDTIEIQACSCRYCNDVSSNIESYFLCFN